MSTRKSKDLGLLMPRYTVSINCINRNKLDTDLFHFLTEFSVAPDLICNGNIDQSKKSSSASSSSQLLSSSTSPKVIGRGQNSYTSLLNELNRMPLVNITTTSSTINRPLTNDCYTCQKRNFLRRQHKLVDQSFEDIYHISAAVTYDEINTKDLFCECHHHQLRKNHAQRKVFYNEHSISFGREPRSAPQITFTQ
jgi:hypothetical protein